MISKGVDAYKTKLQGADCVIIDNKSLFFSVCLSDLIFNLEGEDILISFKKAGLPESLFKIIISFGEEKTQEILTEYYDRFL